MKSRVALSAVVTAIASASIILSMLARPACAAPGQDAEEPGTPAATETAAVPAAPAPPPPASTVATVGDRVMQVLGNDRAWGVGLRARYVSVPGWLLGFFTQNHMPLGTWGHWGIEGFRRIGHLQITAGLSYQNMSPPDGNWLGKGNPPETDTRFLQFRSLSLYSADVAFTGGGMLSSWFGLHAGAGLGLAIVRGNIYVNQSDGCTAANVGDLSQCHPPGVTCANGVCTPVSALSTKPSSDKLPVVPIVNVLVGMDFRLPDLKGWEAKIEGGFFDAFFFGFGVGYTF
jgi:hypothetical protein